MITDRTNTAMMIKKDSVYELLKENILSKHYPPGYKFPSEPVLAKEFGVGRITLRSALNRLEKAGLVFRSPGKGTFASDGRSKKVAAKKFLALVYDGLNSMESPLTYVLPAFERHCERSEIKTETMSVSVIKSLPDADALNILQGTDYDGFLLCNSHYTGKEKEVKLLRALDKPVLIVHAKPNDNVTTGFAVMMSDYKKAWADAVRYLISIGHTEILTVAARNKDNTSYIREFSLAEYFDFMAAEGANPASGNIMSIPYNSPEMLENLSSVMKRKNRPTAILCFSDFYAMQVYESLRKLSFRIPEDISVMGYCGYPGGHMMRPGLSTIDFDYANIGRTAMEILDSSNKWFGIDKEKPSIISPHKLVIRESTKNRIG